MVQIRTESGSERAASHTSLLLPIVSGFVLVFLMAPLAVIVITSFSDARYLVFPPPGWSFRWYTSFFRSPEFTAALWLSLKLAVLVAAATLAASLPVGYALARTTFRGKAAVEALLMSPLFFPNVVLAIALLIFFSRLRILGTLPALFLAHSVVAFPYALRTITAGITTVEPQLEEAAMSLGASHFRAAFSVTLPMIRPSLATAAVFTFIISLDEVVLSLFLSGVGTTTLPVRIFNYIQFTSDATIAAISTVLLLVPLLAIVLFPRVLFGGGVAGHGIGR